MRIRALDGDLKVGTRPETRGLIGSVGDGDKQSKAAAGAGALPVSCEKKQRKRYESSKRERLEQRETKERGARAGLVFVQWGNSPGRWIKRGCTVMMRFKTGMQAWRGALGRCC